TEGSFSVTDIIPTNNYDEETVLRFAASLEQHSEHPIATGIVSSAKEKGISLQEISEFKSMTGKGIQGKISNKNIAAVSPGFVQENNLPYDEKLFSDLSSTGKTVVFLLIDDELAGMIALADIVRETAKEAISLLEKEGIRSIMLTGDNEKVAYWVAGQVGIEDVYAEVLPDEKAIHAKQIMEEKGWKVAMTGDGINDAPALATANLGIATGAGRDVAIGRADVVLIKSNRKDCVSLIDLSKKSWRNMVQNLWWAAGYNIAVSPLAAGILAPVGIILSPAVGAVLMSLSTIIVAINAKL